MPSPAVNSSALPDYSPSPDSDLTSTNLLPFGVLGVVVCVLGVLVLLTALGTCCCWLARARIRKKGGVESGYWAHEDSGGSVTSSRSGGEILREEVDHVRDMSMSRAVDSDGHRTALAPSPSIFSTGDFLMEEVSGSKFRPGICSTAKDHRNRDLTDMKRDQEEISSLGDEELSYYNMPRSASTIALHSLDLETSVLSYGDGDSQLDVLGGECGALDSVGKGGWLFYSIMREIQSSPSCKSMEDEVFISSQEQSPIIPKSENRCTVSERETDVVSIDCLEIINCAKVVEDASDILDREVVVVKDEKAGKCGKQKQPLEVQVIIQKDNGC
eukprot:GFUD01018503.1.p1 GENE.GFUD01018503.1~~GFUD01018503.1.p1  ORF type:complete len:329 (+),score=75.60 GFUD01018503.1:55-1041(+)